MKKIKAYLLVDGLGKSSAEKYGLAAAFPSAIGVKPQFDCAADAAIFSGQPPRADGAFAPFCFAEKRSPFAKFAYLKYCFGAGLHPKCLFNTRAARRFISGALAKKFSLPKSFDILNVPYESLARFDVARNSDIFAANGSGGAENLRGVLEKSRIKCFVSTADKSDDEILRDAAEAAENGACFVFAKLRRTEKFLRGNIKDENAVRGYFESFGKLVARFSARLKAVSEDAEISVLSGYEIVECKSVCDIKGLLKKSGLSFGRGFDAFVAPDHVLFKYDSDDAKGKIRAALVGVSGHFLSEAEKSALGIDFGDRRFGDDIFAADSGTEFSPNFVYAGTREGVASISAQACMLSQKKAPPKAESVSDFFEIMKSDIAECAR